MSESFVPNCAVFGSTSSLASYASPPCAASAAETSFLVFVPTPTPLWPFRSHSPQALREPHVPRRRPSSAMVFQPLCSLNLFLGIPRKPSVPRTPRQCLSLSLRQPRHAYGFFRANCLLPSPYSLRTPRQCPSWSFPATTTPLCPFSHFVVELLV
ncbi:hypothetical protein C8F04DRAFT_1192751 [Mycena alexandri]|uniref:Uncharacterized protein n=1 Tax=Mycena alexandri TaxID=1745969 RepID=A0AAD6SAV6_9AGAR|nr:hypothetical protein C8F04DRAFT_1192751 [Mycena alexandri]